MIKPIKWFLAFLLAGLVYYPQGFAQLPSQGNNTNVSSPAPPQTRFLPSDQAISKWTKRTAANPMDADAWVNLGNAMMQKSREAVDSTLYEKAETAFRRALSVATNNAEALVGLAWVYNTRHEFDQGVRYAKEALAVNPTMQHAYALLGDASVERGDYEAAYEQYQQALDLLPDLSSYSRAAHLLWLTGDARKARWLMQKAVAAGGPHAENTAWCRAELALMTFNTGALLAAEQEAELALKQAPSNHHVLTVMGKIKTARKDYDGAIECYRRALEKMPSHDALVALADLYALTARPEEAEKQYRRVVEFHTTSPAHSHGGNAHVHPHTHGDAQLARFYADHDRDLDEALKEAKTAYEALPNVFVTDTLAWCYYQKGEYKEAEKTIRKALKWSASNADIHFHAGMIYAKLGNRPLAQKHLYQALSINPQFHPLFAPTAADTLSSLSAE